MVWLQRRRGDHAVGDLPLAVAGAEPAEEVIRLPDEQSAVDLKLVVAADITAGAVDAARSVAADRRGIGGEAPNTEGLEPELSSRRVPGMRDVAAATGSWRA